MASQFQGAQMYDLPLVDAATVLSTWRPGERWTVTHAPCRSIDAVQR
jgi:hypothetical protein